MNKHTTLIIILILTSAFIASGCFKQAVEDRQPLPDIIWPKPPEVPRIRFVNSISRPEDLHITEGVLKRFLRFLKGSQRKAVVMPYGIEADAEGRLFVVDTFNRCVHVFDSRNGSYYTFPDKEASLTSPIDIAIDKKGNIYISDSKEAVVKVFKDYGKKYVMAIGKDLLERPTGIAINEKTGELLVIDTLNSVIVRYDIDSYKLKGIAGKSGSEAGRFHYPTNIFVSRDGSVFISDSLNFRIQKLSPDWKFLSALGKPGDGPGYFSRPRGVAVDSDGNIYVVDALFDNVQIFDKEGRLLMDFGSPGHNYGEFWLPSGIFIDNNDMIYVSDSYNKRVQVFQYMKAEPFLNK
ncbi:MAG: SMP-30/gluconolactonase/LRE family protein [Nitrospirae bacterium]|nr:SMP-30/gluconolactonase/LRE family protein [Nitrospirota bacterium]